MVDKSKRGIVGLVLIFLILIGDLLVGFADSPSKPNTFTKAVADTLYCAIASANCLNNYCNTPSQILSSGSDNCNQNFSGGIGGYCPDAVLPALAPDYQCQVAASVGYSKLYLQKTTQTTFTSATFTSIVSGNSWVTPLGAAWSVNNIAIDCTATFDFDTSIAATKALFRIRDVTGNVNSGYSMQLGPGLALNTNETIAMTAEFGNNNDGGSPTIAFQVSVSGVAGTMTIGPGAMVCMRSGDIETATVG